MDYIQGMFELVKSESFDRWLRGLRDRQAVVRTGGDKRTQDADIARAIEIAKDWKD